MALDDYYDDGTGGYIPPPEDDDDPYAGGTPSAPAQPDRRQQIIDGIIIPDFRSIAGQDPTADDINQYYDVYERAGGDEFRRQLGVRFPKTANPTGGTSGGARTPYPAFAPPSFDYPAWAAPSPFTYEAFTPTTAENFKPDAGYNFRAEEGERALKNYNSAQGLLRTGGALKDMMSWREGLASQEFGNVDARRFRDWSSGRDLAKDIYDRDVSAKVLDYNIGYQREADEYARALSTYGMNWDVHQGEFGNVLSLYDLATKYMPKYTPVPMPQV